MRLLHTMRGVAVAALVLAGSGTVRGQLVTTLSVVQDTAPGGLFRYTYTLTNEAASDQFASLFQLGVSPAADLQSISNTLGWDVSYAPGLPNITWTSAIQPDGTTNDLPPGSAGMFSFQSLLGPRSQPYLVVGFDPLGGFGSTNEGFVISAAVPEPSSFMLLALGSVGLIVVARRARASSPARREVNTLPDA